MYPDNRAQTIRDLLARAYKKRLHMKVGEAVGSYLKVLGEKHHNASDYERMTRTELLDLMNDATINGDGEIIGEDLFMEAVEKFKEYFPPKRDGYIRGRRAYGSSETHWTGGDSHQKPWDGTIRGHHDSSGWDGR